MLTASPPGSTVGSPTIFGLSGEFNLLEYCLYVRACQQTAGSITAASAATGHIPDAQQSERVLATAVLFWASSALVILTCDMTWVPKDEHSF